MRYYQFHLGDYYLATQHLSIEEDIVYRRLIDLYYREESKLINDKTKLAKLIRAPGLESVVEAILQEFFELQGDFWVNQRCESEIKIAKERSEKAREAGLARVSKARSIIKRSMPTSEAQQVISERSADAQLTLSERSADAQPTIYHIPDTINQSKKALSEPVTCPSDVSEETWSDYLTLRKSKKAPVTASVLKSLRKDASAIGWSLEQVLEAQIKNGWQGFNPEWVASKKETTPAATTLQSVFRGAL